MQVGLILSMHRDYALDMGDRGLSELVWFDRAGDMGADGARDDHGFGRAEAIRQVDFLREEVRAQTVRSELLGATLEAGIGDLQKAIGI